MSDPNSRMLFYNASFISSNEREKVVVKWIERLSKEESHFESSGGQHISFGEQLLLMAIHFHSNNLEAITDLVSSTLGMRARPGTVTKIKTVFTQELFPEKVSMHVVYIQYDGSDVMVVVTS